MRHLWFCNSLGSCLGGGVHPTETVNRDDSGDVAVGLRVTDPAWLQGLLLRLAGGARVLTRGRR